MNCETVGGSLLDVTGATTGRAINPPTGQTNSLTNSLTIGLTGGVASGKSFVARLFAELGVPQLEADDVGRAVVAPPSPALAMIAEAFGADALNTDGTLDRRRMRERVFTDAGARRQLEAITHPLIRAQIRDWRAKQTAPYCVLGAAILIESGMDSLVDRILLVDAPAELQIERLVSRDAIDPALARSMLAAQATREQRLQRAHDVIDNADTTLDVMAQVVRLDRLYHQIAQTRRRPGF